MCEECQNLVDRYYPHFTDEDKMDLLWSATCFPFGFPEQLEPQLRELRRRTDGSLNAAKAFADTSMTKQHEFIMRRQRAVGGLKREASE